MRLVNIGYGNLIAAERIVAVVSPEAAPVRRMVQDARDRGRVVDATCGHKTRAVITMNSDHLVLSPLTTETIAGRVNSRKEEKES